MNILAILIPVSLGLGALGLIAFLWSLRADQYEDMDGAAWRILMDDETLPDADEDKDKNEAG
tara:strand:- start:344 stop:529 length:186 start_codon:yes stop_codon:yes gene_type:complete